ncbi:MAG: hypothetical protein ACFNOM_01215 [Parascardovia denticolens]
MTAFFFGELRACRRSWISLGLMVLVAASLLSLSLGMVIAGSQASSDDVLEEYVTLGGMQLAFTVISILAMLPPLTATAIRVDSPRIARWQLVGSTVRQSMGLYFAMLLTVATAGSALGLALAFLAWPGFARLLVRVHPPAIAALSRPLSSLALILGLVTTVVAVGLAGLIALGSLKKVDPIAAVREQSGFRIRRVNPARLVLGILLLAGLLGGYFAISRMKPMADPQVLSGLLAAYWREGMGLIVVNLLLSPLLAPLFVHLVSAFLPSRFSPSAFLTKCSARFRVRSTTVLVAPVAVAGIIGSIMGMARQIRQISSAQGIPSSDIQISPSGQILLEFVSPLILATVATYCAIAVTGRQRSIGVALLRLEGVPIRCLVRSSIIEALVYSLGSTLLCQSALATNAFLMGEALSLGPIPSARYWG